MTEPSKHEPATWKPGPIGPRRVLVVDDNVGSATILAKLVTKLWSHEVVVAHDGLSALDLAQKHRPQIVLLDIGLPGMDGYEVAKQLRGQPQFAETLIVALTGYGLDADRLRSADAGFDKHLVKPISVSVLEELFAHAKLTGQVGKTPSESVHAGPESHPSDK
jgi:CheY-like chemotaxis protein